MMQRAKSVSPYRRAAAQGEVTACYVNEQWRKSGMAAVFVLRVAPGGGMTLASYLVDMWCMGLKDAWGRLQYSRAEFDGVVERQLSNDALVRLDIDRARQIVFGGVQFAKQNGFRLPKNYERWTAMLGPAPDPQSLDMSIFGKDGKLLFTGGMSDLNQRLMQSTADEFLKRPDVEWTVKASDDLIDAEEEEFDGPDSNEACEALVDRRATEMSQQCRDWLVARNEAPHPMLQEACRCVLYGITELDDIELGDLSTPEDLSRSWEGLEYLAVNSFDSEDGAMIEDAIEAIEQVMAYLRERGAPVEFKDEYDRAWRDISSSRAT